jgi:hypothetical protein
VGFNTRSREQEQAQGSSDYFLDSADRGTPRSSQRGGACWAARVRDWAGVHAPVCRACSDVAPPQSTSSRSWARSTRRRGA